MSAVAVAETETAPAAAIADEASGRDPVDPEGSLTEVLGEQPKSRCGYCGKKDSSSAFGAWMYSLSVDDYEAMVFRGWRRSGHYCYRPDLAASCCPPFVIRLRAEDYRPSSTQKRVLSRLRRAEAPKAAAAASAGSSSKAGAKNPQRPRDPPVLCEAVRQYVCDALRNLAASDAGNAEGLGSCFSHAASAEVSVMLRDPSKKAGTKGGRKLNSPAQKRRRNGVGSSATAVVEKANGKRGGVASADRVAATGVEGESAICQVATNAAMVVAGMERRRSESGSRGASGGNVQSRQTEIAESLSSELRQLFSALSVDIVVLCALPGWVNIRLPSDAGEALCAEFTLMGREGRGDAMLDSTRPDCSVSEGRDLDENEAWKNPSKRPDAAGGSHEASTSFDESDSESGVEDCKTCPKVEKVPLHPIQSGRKFRMEFAPSSFQRDEYLLYRQYQMTVHKSKAIECTERTYRRFLVDSPLRHVVRPGGPDEGYGSFHIRYTLDGRLVAVGVVDILPQCLSSVYLVYDAAFAELSPGVLTAVKEIEWVQNASRSSPELRWYVMGYFIHSTPKMAYKALYQPSELLCEDTKHWVPTANALAVLDAARTPTTRLAPAGVPPAAAAHPPPESTLKRMVGEMRMKLDHAVVPFGEIERVFGQELAAVCPQLRAQLTRFARLVGVEYLSHFTNWLQDRDAR